MEFNTDRLLALSGIKDEGTQPLNEGKELVTDAKTKSEDTLAEAKVRSAIRREIESIVQEMRAKGDTDWLYRGMRKPRRSKPGQVAMGLLGIGFADVYDGE